MAKEKRNPGEAESKPRRNLLDVFRKVRDITALTQQEKTLILCILFSMLLGKTVQHWRRVQREKPLPPVSSPAPFSRAKDFYTPKPRVSPSQDTERGDEP